MASTAHSPNHGRSSGHIAVVNAGAWGTALATLLANAGHDVRLWCRRPELADQIASSRENRVYLPDVAVPPTVRPTADLADVVEGARAVLLAPISRAMRETARAVAPLVDPTAIVLHAAKGFEHPSLLRLSEVVEEELDSAFHGRVAALSGPTHAEEVARGLPTASVVACPDRQVAEQWQQLLHGPTFRVYSSVDTAGVELCGGLKNVVALAVGASDGLGYGDNARAALITRSLAEIGRLVQTLGGDLRTVAGLAGLGDVVATCTSRHSRNRWAGEQLGRGRGIDEILASTPQVVEGVPAARAANLLAERYRVSLPVCTEVFRVLYEGASPQEVLRNLMAREATAEL